MRKKIIVVLKVPFLDKIPSLKSLLDFLSKNGFAVTVISASSPNYPITESSYANIRFKLVKQRTKKYELPTSAKLLWEIIKVRFSNEHILFIGGDNDASKILSKLKRILHINYINFLLEYPSIENKYEEQLPLIKSKYIITHDKWHADFLKENFAIKESQLLLLPNSSPTPPPLHKGDTLFKLFDFLEDSIVILHSGGLGEWFLCDEIAQAALRWDDNMKLVFHTSHNVESTDYYKNMISRIPSKSNIYFSTRPVPTNELDNLVSSAHIGLAFYNESLLKYRATGMGLAAGKIGNYLKCSIPVIATKLSSLHYIEEYKCGILIDSPSEIKDAAETIISNYNRYAQNALKCYTELWEPTPYLRSIVDRLEE